MGAAGSSAATAVPTRSASDARARATLTRRAEWSKEDLIMAAAEAASASAEERCHQPDKDDGVDDAEHRTRRRYLRWFAAAGYPYHIIPPLWQLIADYAGSTMYDIRPFSVHYDTSFGRRPVGQWDGREVFYAKSFEGDTRVTLAWGTECRDMSLVRDERPSPLVQFDDARGILYILWINGDRRLPNLCIGRAQLTRDRGTHTVTPMTFTQIASLPHLVHPVNERVACSYRIRPDGGAALVHYDLEPRFALLLEFHTTGAYTSRRISAEIAEFQQHTGDLVTSSNAAGAGAVGTMRLTISGSASRQVVLPAPGGNVVEWLDWTRSSLFTPVPLICTQSCLFIIMRRKVAIGDGPTRIVMFALDGPQLDHGRVLWEAPVSRVRSWSVSALGILSVQFQLPSSARYLEHRIRLFPFEQLPIPMTESAHRNPHGRGRDGDSASAGDAPDTRDRPLDATHSHDTVRRGQVRDDAAFACRIDLIGSENPRRVATRAYRLVAELPRPWDISADDHSVYHGSIDAKAAQQPWVIALPRGLPRSTSIAFRLFLDRYNDEKQVVQVEAATATIPADWMANKSSWAVSLVDRDGRDQGRLTMSRTSTSASYQLADADADTDDVPRFDTMSLMADRARFSGLPVWGPVITDLRRLSVRYGNGADTQSVPVWAVVLLPAEPLSDRFLNNALQYVTRYSGFVDEFDWARRAGLDEPGTHDVLAQVLGWFPWSCAYVNDMTWDDAGKRYRLNDQFTTLAEKETFAMAAGDCEDFACGCMWLFRALIARDPTYYGYGSPLRVLIELAQLYCAFVTDVSIYNGKDRLEQPASQDEADSGVGSLFTTQSANAARSTGVQLHMYVQLLPWNTVVSLIETGNRALTTAPAVRTSTTPLRDALGDATLKRSALCPMLSLEATEPCLSDWSRTNAPDAKAIDAYYAHAHQIRQSGLGAGPVPKAVKTAWARLRPRVTPAGYQRDQFYRALIAMYSPQLYDLLGYRHSWLPCVTSPLRAGAPADEWTNAHSAGTRDDRLGFAFVALPAASALDRKALQLLSDRAPLAHRLDLRADQMALSAMPERKGKTPVILIGRALGWTAEYDKIVRDAIRASGRYDVLPDGFQTVPVTATNSIVVYQLWPRAAASVKA